MNTICLKLNMGFVPEIKYIVDLYLEFQLKIAKLTNFATQEEMLCYCCVSKVCVCAD